MEFWRAQMMNHDLRGNAYARIDRAADGEPIALWQLRATQRIVQVRQRERCC